MADIFLFPQSALDLLRAKAGSPLAFRAPPSPFVTLEGAASKNGGATTYALYVEKKPGMFGWPEGELKPFPSDNYLRTTDEHKQNVQAEAKRLGYKISI